METQGADFPLHCTVESSGSLKLFPREQLGRWEAELVRTDSLRTSRMKCSIIAISKLHLTSINVFPSFVGFCLKTMHCEWTFCSH